MTEPIKPDWWRGLIPNSYAKDLPPHLKQNDLPNYIPKPGRVFDHKLGYAIDDWKTIELIKGGSIDPNFSRFRMTCQGCSVKCEFMQPSALYDSTLKWLCDDCIDLGGFAWGHQIQPSQWVEYQLVRTYEDDTLLRKLSKSPNYKEPQHDAFFPEENKRTQIGGTGGGSGASSPSP